MLNYILLGTALSLSATAAFYSIAGLTSIFNGAFYAILVMGIVLETAKVVTTAWLHRNWKYCPTTIKSYLTAAIVVLMFITSMGIFGFLSKAHLQHSADGSGIAEQVNIIEQKIDYEKKRSDNASKALSQLDASVQVLLDNNRLRGENGAIALRASQKVERESLLKEIETANNNLSNLNAEKLTITTQQRTQEVEVGPLTYITEFIYGETDDNLLNKSVRYVILVIVFVFDPLALLLLICSNISFQKKPGRPPGSKNKPKQTLSIRGKNGKIEIDKSGILHM